MDYTTLGRTGLRVSVAGFGTGGGSRLGMKTGKTTANGLEVPTWTAVHTDLPFRLAGSSTGDGGTHTVTVGGVEFQQATGVGHMPASIADLKDNDLIDVTSGEWAGTVLRVVEATKKDQATARRVPVVEVARPTEWV